MAQERLREDGRPERRKNTAPPAGPAERRKALFLVNRRARQGERDFGPILERLTERLLPTVVDIEDPARIGEELERAWTDQVRRVVVAGGDGTINAALPFVVRRELPLGVVPLGTANDFARTLGLPQDPLEAAAVAARGITRRIDVASVNDIYFVNAAGLGFSTALKRRLAPSAKGLLGRLAYPLGVVRHWRSQRPFTCVLDLGGMPRRHRVIQATIANGRFYGGGMVIHRDARIDDGILDVLLVHPRPLSKYLWRLVRLTRGAHEDAPVTAYRTGRVEIRTHRSRSVAADGEIATSTPARFEVHSRALRVVVRDERRA